MKTLLIVLAFVAAIVLAVVATPRLSSDAMAVIVGVVVGIAVSIPTSLVMLAMFGRREGAAMRDEPAVQMPPAITQVYVAPRGQLYLVDQASQRALLPPGLPVDVRYGEWL